MSTEMLGSLRRLVRGARVAALGTLHDGEPSVSMVPYAVLDDGAGLVVHVSELAAHTGDMRASPRVSVMIMAADSDDVTAQALPRVTIQADAERLARDDSRYRPAKDVYVARFPRAARLFELADFALFAIRPVSIRLIAGFAQAVTLPGDALSAALAKPRG